MTTVTDSVAEARRDGSTTRAGSAVIRPAAAACSSVTYYPCGHRRLLREGGAGGAEETRTPAEGEPLGNEYRAGVGVVGLRTARHGDGRWGTATTTTQGRSEHRARHFC